MHICTRIRRYKYTLAHHFTVYINRRIFSQSTHVDIPNTPSHKHIINMGIHSPSHSPSPSLPMSLLQLKHPLTSTSLALSQFCPSLAPRPSRRSRPYCNPRCTRHPPWPSSPPTSEPPSKVCLATPPPTHTRADRMPRPPLNEGADVDVE